MSGDELRDHLEQMEAVGAAYKFVYESGRDGGGLEARVAAMAKLTPSKNARVWRSYKVPGQEPEVSWAEHDAGLTPVMGAYPDVRHDDVTYHPFPGGVVFQCIYSFTASDGTEVRFPAALVWYIDRDGKIAYIAEHFESHDADRWFSILES
ncbi:hypothetical protein ASE00_01760 [Sphingomonas sp. Root710]|nr:hypothetical protein ASE00_01760 [Sphingomonas sp. Root710]